MESKMDDHSNNVEPTATYNQEKKATVLQKRKEYYIGKNRKESEFEALDGHLRRAILREANFQVASLMKAPSMQSELSDNNYAKANELLGVYCEYYAHVGNQEEHENPYNRNTTFKRLTEADSKAIYLDYDTMQGRERLGNKTNRHAVHTEESIQRHAPKDANGKVIAAAVVKYIAEKHSVSKK